MMKIGLSDIPITGSAFPDAKGSSAPSANNKLSFSGLNLGKAADKAAKKAGGSLRIEKFDKYLKQSDLYVGKNFVQNIYKNFVLNMGDKASDYVKIENNALVFRKESFLVKLKEGTFDVLKLPIDIASVVLDKLGDFSLTKGSNAIKKAKNLPVFKKRKQEKLAMENFHKLKGIAETGKPYELRKKIFHVPAGTPVGNYNAKSERALNRLATGAISSMFVGTDFYNLVMYEKNDKKEADKAARRRRNREFSRFALSAFMTYSVLSALSSYVNKNMYMACAAIAGSSLFSEVVTRLVTGTPLVPLTSEGAKKYNQKRMRKRGGLKNKNKENAPKAAESVKQIPQSPQLITAPVLSGTLSDITGKGVFAGFKSPVTDLAAQQIAKTQAAGSMRPSKDDDRHKSPLTLKNVGIALAGLSAFNALYAFAKLKSNAFNKLVIGVNTGFENLYKKLAKEDLIANEKQLREFLGGFTNDNMGAISQAYGRILNVTFTEKEAKQLMKTASSDGTIKITNSSDIYRKAYRRTSDRDFRRRLREIWSDDVVGYYERKGELTRAEIKHVASDSSHLKFQDITFNLDMKNPYEIINGVKYYSMKDPVFNFGRIKDAKTKVVADAASYIIKMVKGIISFPTKVYRGLSGKLDKISGASGKVPAQNVEPLPEIKTKHKSKKSKYSDIEFEVPDLGELYRDCTVMRGKLQQRKITLKEFSKYMEMVNTKSFNTDSAPTYPATTLASVSRNFVTLISSYFFINDFRNEVLIQSNGENTKKAAEVTKERTAHKVSNYVLNKFFMDIFNHTFTKQYLGSLLGASTVAIATEITNESTVRGSIGIPITKQDSREAIEKYEREHIEKQGLLGAYYRFMARLTGKKMLSEKANKE